MLEAIKPSLSWRKDFQQFSQYQYTLSTYSNKSILTINEFVDRKAFIGFKTVHFPFDHAIFSELDNTMTSIGKSKIPAIERYFMAVGNSGISTSIIDELEWTL